MPHLIVASHMNQLYREALDLVSFGKLVTPRGLDTVERENVTLHLTDAKANVLVSPARNLNYPFMLAEWLWVTLGMNDRAMIKPYNMNIAAFAEDSGHFMGAYGPRYIDQLPYIIKTLQKDPMSRQAVMTFWRPRPGDARDVPCTVALQFILRPGEMSEDRQLNLTVFMRSNDAWLGLPYDLFTFTMIQQEVAAYLEVPVGTYTHQATSLHLYVGNPGKEKMMQVIEEPVTHNPLAPTITTHPMPPAFRAMYLGLTLLQGQGGAEDIIQWVIPNAEAMVQPWGGILLALAYRFHKDPQHLDQYWRWLIDPVWAAANG